jgi:hypothetical protein
MMFSEDGHTAPAPLPILLVLQDELAAHVLHALPLPRHGGVDDSHGLGVPQVKVLPMPGNRKQATTPCIKKIFFGFEIFRGKTRVVDPDPDWIRIQRLCGSGSVLGNLDPDPGVRKLKNFSALFSYFFIKCYH